MITCIINSAIKVQQLTKKTHVSDYIISSEVSGECCNECVTKNMLEQASSKNGECVYLCMST